MANGHGGVRTPANPAAVSTPGSGRRTDGGAGSSRQPLRVPTGGAYGDTKAATEQQQAAPLAAGPTAGAASPQPAGGGGGAPRQAPTGVFGPTQRPNESNSAGIGTPQGNPMVGDPQAVLRILYGQFPHPAIRRLIDDSAYGSHPPR
jgi:hypothetical protein